MLYRKHSAEEVVNMLRKAAVIIAWGSTVVEAPAASVYRSRPPTAGGPSKVASEWTRRDV